MTSDSIYCKITLYLCFLLFFRNVYNNKDLFFNGVKKYKKKLV